MNCKIQLAACMFLTAIAAGTVRAQQATPPAILKQVGISQNLNTQIPRTSRSATRMEIQFALETSSAKSRLFFLLSTSIARRFARKF